MLASREGKTEEEVLKEEVKKEKLHVSEPPRWQLRAWRSRRRRSAAPHAQLLESV